MDTLQIIRASNGEELVVLPRAEYEALVQRASHADEDADEVGAPVVVPRQDLLEPDAVEDALAHDFLRDYLVDLDQLGHFRVFHLVVYQWPSGWTNQFFHRYQ